MLLEVLLVICLIISTFGNDERNYQFYSPRVMIKQQQEEGPSNYADAVFYNKQQHNQEYSSSTGQQEGMNISATSTINDHSEYYEKTDSQSESAINKEYKNRPDNHDISYLSHNFDHNNGMSDTDYFIQTPKLDIATETTIPVSRDYSNSNSEAAYHYKTLKNTRDEDKLSSRTSDGYFIQRPPLRILGNHRRKLAHYTDQDYMASESASRGYGSTGGGGGISGSLKTFPPPSIIAKIGSKYRPPCHGPECHNHHKGVVKFWWKKVIKPKTKKKYDYGYGKFAGENGHGGKYLQVKSVGEGVYAGKRGGKKKSNEGSVGFKVKEGNSGYNIGLRVYGGTKSRGYGSDSYNKHDIGGRGYGGNNIGGVGYGSGFFSGNNFKTGGFGGSYVNGELHDGSGRGLYSDNNIAEVGYGGNRIGGKSYRENGVEGNGNKNVIGVNGYRENYSGGTTYRDKGTGRYNGNSIGAVGYGNNNFQGETHGGKGTRGYIGNNFGREGYVVTNFGDKNIAGEANTGRGAGGYGDSNIREEGYGGNNVGAGVYGNNNFEGGAYGSNNGGRGAYRGNNFEGVNGGNHFGGVYHRNNIEGEAYGSSNVRGRGYGSYTLGGGRGNSGYIRALRDFTGNNIRGGGNYGVNNIREGRNKDFNSGGTAEYDNNHFGGAAKYGNSHFGGAVKYDKNNFEGSREIGRYNGGGQEYGNNYIGGSREIGRYNGGGQEYGNNYIGGPREIGRYNGGGQEYGNNYIGGPREIGRYNGVGGEGLKSNNGVIENGIILLG